MKTKYMKPETNIVELNCGCNIMEGSIVEIEPGEKNDSPRAKSNNFNLFDDSDDTWGLEASSELPKYNVWD